MKSKKQNNQKLLRIVIIAAVLAVVAFCGIIVSDILFGNHENLQDGETVTITVSGEDIYLNGNLKVTTEVLDSKLNGYLGGEEKISVALLTDSASPADPETYNAVVKLLDKYGVTKETLPLASTPDQMSTNTEYAQ